MRVQKVFVEVLIDELEDNPFTFPVMTAAQLKDKETGKIMDTEWLQWIAEMTQKNAVFNFYTSDSVDSLSSCIAADQIITIKNKNTQIVETLPINVFVHRFIKDSQTDVELHDIPELQQYQIQGFDPLNDISEWVDIVGVLKRSNISNKLIKLEIDNKTICVTPDHPIYVKNKHTGVISKIEAVQLLNNLNINDYFISIE